MPVIPQRRIDVDELVEFIKNIEPLTDKIHGSRYRAAVRLVDNTYLPCVIFQSRRLRLELALRRLDELRNQSSQYRMVIESFVSSGSHIAEYEIKAVELSPFAWPASILNEIHGETVMGWTAFVVEMTDGSMHSYGTALSTEFFDLPNGYSYSDIAKIHSGMVHASGQNLAHFSSNSTRYSQLYRERPFFTCYLDPL